MKLRSLISVVDSSIVFVYSNPSFSNDFNSDLLCHIECSDSKNGKKRYCSLNRISYYSLLEFDIVSVIQGKDAICVFVEEPLYGEI